MKKSFWPGAALCVLLSYSLSAGSVPPEAAVAGNISFAEEHPTLAIGAAAPDFHLPGIDGKTYSLGDFSDAKVLVIVFMCNHCPTSQAYEQRMIKITADYRNKGVAVVAINPNHPQSVRLDELGYSDLGDSFEEMKVRARDAGFNFPYLFDGETEATSKKYGPVATPHIFIFDRQRILRYNGRIDDMEDPAKMPRTQDARKALDALLAGRPVPDPETKTFGCSTKWAEKTDWIQKAEIKWAKEPVDLDPISVDSIAAVKKNAGEKLRLIWFWSSATLPCVKALPDLAMLLHMYRDRGYEMTSVCLDDVSAKEHALGLLKENRISSPNFICSGIDRRKLAATVRSSWKGAVPFTMLVDPGGQVVYEKEGPINTAELKRTIFNDSTMGRIYK